MKRNIVFVVIVLMIGMQTFADENLRELKSINIEWQLCNNKAAYTKLNISGFNPLFFYNRNYGLLNMENIFQDNGTQNEQSLYKNSQENDWFGFLLVVAGYSVIWTDAYKNPLRYRYFENVWERQQQEESMYRNIIRNND
jgi:hypothetical protein